MKSPHVHKKARAQYEIQTHKTIISFKNYTKTIDFQHIIKFLVLNKPKHIKISLEYTRQG